ncbi:MAG: hypothetical protein MUC72_01360 [Acidobacteria bacterium]|jgi:hypothetical protein|nr:hypothetical protein [Acidobacteriota bacterium]
MVLYEISGGIAINDSKDPIAISMVFFKISHDKNRIVGECVVKPIEDILKDVRDGNITKKELVSLLAIGSREEFQPVFEESTRICRRHLGCQTGIFI